MSVGVVGSKELHPGTIIWIYPKDPRPHAPLAVEHPAIILTPQDQIDAGADLFVVVCTTSFSYPLRSGWFEVPAKPGGHEMTGLDQACVAKATWTDIVPQSEILRHGKRAKASLVRQILQWLRDMERDLTRKGNQDPTRDKSN